MNNDPQLQTILGQLKNFGFEYYGNDESGMPLVKGPNSQIVSINVAVEFVNKQIREKQESATSHSPEEMPEMPDQPDLAGSIEKNFEAAPEQEKTPEREEKQPQQNTPRKVVTPQPTTVSPQVKARQTLIKPYGDGFEPQSFNPEDINSTLSFVEKNSKLSKTSSNKWLAEQFKKFVTEFKSRNNE